MAKLDRLLKDVRSCDICADNLPLGPRPMISASTSAKVLIIGQAPGTKVHETGIAWNDPSGDRLRDWMQVGREDFYDDQKIAIMPMGFCYPGKVAKGGDKSPRPECAPTWHEKILQSMPQIELTLLVGMYAQKYYLGRSAKKTLTETVNSWRDYGPAIIPTPHPSWRTTGWLKKNVWFEKELLPVLRSQIKRLV